MILIFLGNWRMTLIASMSIPLAILGAIIGLYVTGNTINAMTLGGLALAIGPLVDDAIVELENNHRNYSLGKSRIRAALDGCAEVMIPVLVATCTTIIVLAPLALMPGMGGFLFRPLALAVTFAMVTSFLLSRTFVPMMCAKFLPDEHGPAGSVGAAGAASLTRHGSSHDDHDLEPARSRAAVPAGRLRSATWAASPPVPWSATCSAARRATSWGIVAGSLLGSLTPLFVLWHAEPPGPASVFRAGERPRSRPPSRGPSPTCCRTCRRAMGCSSLTALKYAALAGLVTVLAVWAGRFIVGRSHRTEHYINRGTRFYERLLALALRRRFLVLAACSALFVGLADADVRHRPRVLPAGGRRPDHHLRARSLEHAPGRGRAARRRGRALHREAHPGGRARDDRLGDGPRSGLVGGLHGQLRAAGRRSSACSSSDKRTHSAQEYAIKLRHLFAAEPRFADLRFSFDTGGMVSTALNLGASSPIDIQIEGGKGEQRRSSWPRTSATASPTSTAPPTCASCSGWTPPT